MTAKQFLLLKRRRELMRAARLYGGAVTAHRQGAFNEDHLADMEDLLGRAAVNFAKVSK